MSDRLRTHLFLKIAGLKYLQEASGNVELLHFVYRWVFSIVGIGNNFMHSCRNYNGVCLQHEYMWWLLYIPILFCLWSAFPSQKKSSRNVLPFPKDFVQALQRSCSTPEFPCCLSPYWKYFLNLNVSLTNCYIVCRKKNTVFCREKNLKLFLHPVYDSLTPDFFFCFHIGISYY